MKLYRDPLALTQAGNFIKEIELKKKLHKAKILIGLVARLGPGHVNLFNEKK